MAELHRLAQAMCSIDLADSNWTQELPRLPVPDLWTTIDRYLGSLRAVLAPELEPEDTMKELQADAGQDQAHKDNDERTRKRLQFIKTQRLARHFLLNEGPTLQRDLKEYANKSQNWATDYWLQDMYLSNPIPLPVNSNPFFMFPRQKFDNSREMIMFATRIIQFSVDFKFRIDQQTIKQDYGSGHGRGKPLCMETYKNFFHSYRMPHEDVDRLLPQSRRSNHIVVASCDQFYILRLGQEPLPDPYSKEPAANQMDEGSIYEQLMRIYRVSREQKRRLGASIPQVGLLTTENRKVWAKWHKRLVHCNHPHQTDDGGHSTPGSGSSSPNSNGHSLRQIEDCLFVMCLDSLVASNESKQNRRRRGSLDEQPDDVREATVVLTGGGSDRFTANRWFDKFLQIVVGRDGVCGINIEHSASEGITVLRFLQEFLDYIQANPVGQEALNKVAAGGCKLAGGPSVTSPVYVEPDSPTALLQDSENITALVWTLNGELEEAIEVARQRVDRLVENFSLQILHFDSFGRWFIKSQRLSPDAFVQLALQLTFYKLHGCLVSTYESASLRQFRLGRVDNIRANTCEAYAWIRAMLACRSDGARGLATDEPASGLGLDWTPAIDPFNCAITKQVEILKYTITGTGPDNHLLALRQSARIRYDDDMPELFTDQSYGEFLNFRLSTSQLPNESGIVVGYGAVTPDGYGCSYNPCEDSITFCISSFADCPITSSSKFAKTLRNSLLEMQELCLSRAAN